MQEEVDSRAISQESQPNTELEPTEIDEKKFVESFNQSWTALNKTGVLRILPGKNPVRQHLEIVKPRVRETLGIKDQNGIEYRLPEEEEIRHLYKLNEALIQKKHEQFGRKSRVLLTPMAMPIPLLIARAEREIVRHAQEGKIFQTKHSAQDQNIVIRVDANEPVWVWDTVREAIKTDEIVYFPYQLEGNHKGKSKSEIINDPKICAIPGWSVGLVEDTTILHQQGEGRTVDGRKQFETNLTPKDYLKTLQGGSYNGETGWTYEDFLSDFMVNLQNTNQVSHESYEHSAVWLVGSYLPSSACVPSGDWARGSSQLDVDAGDPGDRGGRWGVRSTVRLGI